jgi:Tol biopolymer transport system component
LNNAQKVFVIVLVAAVAFLSGCSQNNGFPVVTGEYLGQNLPGIEPLLFAPGLISTGLYERDLAISPDGQEMYYGLISGGQVTIMMTRIEGGTWIEPKVAPFASNPDYLYFEPCFSPDGNRLFFLSTLPPPGQEAKPGWGNQNIWVVDRSDGGDWSEPQDVGPPVNTDDEEYFPSITHDGTLYFTRSLSNDHKAFIMRSHYHDGAFTEPELLPEQVNGKGIPYNAFIAPDESYLIACVEGRDDCVTQGYPDYYVFFRSPDDTWSEGINLGQSINPPKDRALSPCVSPDGRYFFFSSARNEAVQSTWGEITWSVIQHLHVSPQNGSSDIYWVDAQIIKRLRPEGFD